METKRVARRKHSAQFRADVLWASCQADAFVAAIALRNGLNANVVYRWLREEAQGVEAGAGSHAAVSARRDGEFIAVQMPAPAVASPDIPEPLCLATLACIFHAFSQNRLDPDFSS